MSGVTLGSPSGHPRVTQAEAEVEVGAEVGAQAADAAAPEAPAPSAKAEAEAGEEAMVEAEAEEEAKADVDDEANVQVEAGEEAKVEAAAAAAPDAEGAATATGSGENERGSDQELPTTVAQAALKAGTDTTRRDGPTCQLNSSVKQASARPMCHSCGSNSSSPRRRVTAAAAVVALAAVRVCSLCTGSARRLEMTLTPLAVHIPSEHFLDEDAQVQLELHQPNYQPAFHRTYVPETAGSYPHLSNTAKMLASTLH